MNLQINEDENFTFVNFSNTIEDLTFLFWLEHEIILDRPLEQEELELQNSIRNELGGKIEASLLPSKNAMDKLFENNKANLSGMFEEINDAEASIKSSYYKELRDKMGYEQLEEDNFYHLMRYHPGFMARRINRMDFGFLSRFFRHKQLHEKCYEFIVFKNKAKKLYERETAKQNALREAFIKKILNIRAEDYHKDMFSIVPAEDLRNLVRTVFSREIHSREDFSPAQAEPFNVVIGKMFLNVEAILNEMSKKFLTENYDFIFDGNNLVFPYTIAINENLALCYKYGSTFMEQAQKDMRHLCMSIFLMTPPGKMRFCFIDPIRMGHSFAVFNNFEDNNTSSVNVITGGKILTEKEDIERQLKILVSSINTMLSTTFRDEYHNIREYNDANPLAPQPYHIVGIMDFPAGFTNEALEMLEKIVTEGKRCGIYVIIMKNESQTQNIAIENQCACFKAVDGGYKENSEDGSEFLYKIEAPLETSEVLKIAPIMKQAIRAAERITIEYDNIAPAKEEYLKSNIDDGISIPIGLSSSREILSLELGKHRSQSVHALICGQIGSGKSKLLHAIITGALLKYPKEELEIYLIDFKSGTEFKIYADYNLPSLKVVALESEPEFGLNVLRALSDEKERRAQAFNSNSIEDLPAYNNTNDAKNGGRLPRILIVIDEFHVLFGGADSAIRSEAVRLLDDILRLDRNVGFHVVLCSQSIRGMNALNEAALAQIAVRIALKCPLEDAKIVLGSEANTIDQIEENDAGSAVYVPAISSSRTVKFRVGLLRREKQAELLQTLDDYYTSKSIKADTRVLASNIYDNRNSVFQRYWLDFNITTKDRVIHVGEPLKVNASLEIRFMPALSNNLLLLGKNTQKAQNILFFAVLDLLLQKVKSIREASPSCNIYVANYCDGTDIILNDSLKRLGKALPHLINYYDSDNAKSCFESIYNKFNEKNNETMPDDWLIVSNMVLASELQSGSIYGSHRENANRFKKILQEGPAKGIFTIAWCDNPALFKAKFNGLYEDFGKQIVFNVSQEDAMTIANIVNDDSINRNNAYLHQEGKGTEKFRPYSSPMDKWLNSMIEKLNMEHSNG